MVKIKFVFFLFLILTASTVVIAQKNTESKNPISDIKVSRELKERLQERFDLYVKYQIEQNYEKQFELIPPRLIASENCKEFYSFCVSGKTEFIEQQKESEKWHGLIKNVVLANSGKRLDKKRNQIIFTVLLENERGKYPHSVYLDVFLDNGDWYFSTFYTVEI